MQAIYYAQQSELCRVKYIPASWLEISPLLKLKVSFLKFMEVWILLSEVSPPFTSLPWRSLPEVAEKGGAFLLPSQILCMRNESTKGRLTGRKATDFI